MTPDTLRSKRVALGLSQTDLAKILDVRQATVSDWETGKSPIPGWLTIALIGVTVLVAA